MLSAPKALICGVEQLFTHPVTVPIIYSLQVEPKMHAQIYPYLASNKIWYQDVKTTLFPWLDSDSNQLHISDLNHILKGLEYKHSILILLKQLINRGVKVCLLSAGFDITVKKIADIIGTKHFYYNCAMTQNENGFITDVQFFQEEAQLKLQQVFHFLSKNKLEPYQCLFVPTSESDHLVTQFLQSMPLSNLTEGISESIVNSFNHSFHFQNEI